MPTYTEADRKALAAAIATGAKRVKFADGRETEFRTLPEMRDLLAEMDREINPNSAAPLRTVGSFQSGL